MSRSRPLALGIAVVVLLALAGCSVPAPAPVNDIERREIRQQLLDRTWQTVSSRYPVAVRPVVSIARTVDDPDVGPLVAECLEAAGFRFLDGTFLVLTEGQTRLEFALARYSCVARYPALSAVAASLSDDQIGSLWEYYTARVRPCLASLGIDSSSPPEKGFFIDRYGFDTWNPFDLLRATEQSSDTLELALERCPPVPDWLDLATDQPATP